MLSKVSHGKERKRIRDKIAGRYKSPNNDKTVNILILGNIDNTKNTEIDEAISEHR